jgi:protease-4
MKGLSFVHLVVLLVLLAGCGRVRFVIDAVPAEDALTESAVLEDPGGGLGSSKVALIDVTGLIVDAPQPGLLAPGENPMARFAESLRRAEADGAVKAVILRVNSPGGTVTASDVMYREVMHFKGATRKPVVVLQGDVAASGGYYLSCAGDEIIAHPTSITGSIGVIMQTFNFSDGMSRIGIRADAITSGPNKAVGSPFQPMSESHRELLQGLVDEFYANFRAIVVERRPHVSPSDLEWITDGRVVTGKKAHEAGLVDGLGDLHDAFASAKRRANLSGARLVKYHRPLEHVGSAYAAAPAVTGGRAGEAAAAISQVNLFQLNVPMSPGLNQPNFWYLWDPAAW